MSNIPNQLGDNHGPISNVLKKQHLKIFCQSCNQIHKNELEERHKLRQAFWARYAAESFLLTSSTDKSSDAKQILIGRR